jgi:LmbE family N-acetylglucosaminyl deacetylase
MNNKILIVIAHPDDEILWMWWTIQKLINEWKNINILLLSKPWNARSYENSEIRLNNFRDIMKILWINNIFYENFPDTSFDSVRLLDIIQSVEKVVNIVKPEIVYTHFYNDLNIDHCITSKAVITALRPIKNNSFIKKIFLFEIPSSTELSVWLEKFIPNHYENIEENIENKKKLLSVYKSELQESPYPRSLDGVETLAKYRWLECWLDCAEAFILYRSIN